MDMGHEQIQLQGVPALGKSPSQLPHAGSCVDNDGIAGREGDLNAGGIASVNHGFRSWGSYRASCPPKGDFHGILFFRVQEITSALTGHRATGTEAGPTRAR